MSDVNPGTSKKQVALILAIPVLVVVLSSILFLMAKENVINFGTVNRGTLIRPPVPLPELPCEKSDAYFVLRDGAAGVFLAANTFPKSRETRAPLVEELYRFRDRLPEKLRYLADAPQQDPEGNKTLVRFSRKTKQQYVASEKEGKATGWSAFFIDGKWTEAKK